MSVEEGLFGSEGVEAPPLDDGGTWHGGREPSVTAPDRSSGVSSLRRPFDASRLRASVERARAAAAQGDPALVDEVVDIVTFSLASREGQASGGVNREEVGVMVERTLVELGQAGVAREYILARDRRARARAAREAGGPSTAPSSGVRLPPVEGRTGSRPFDGGRVVAGLVEEAGLEEEAAAAIARRVEEFLRGASLRSVTSGLVRELVNHALLEAGLQGALRRHEAVGVPRRDLKVMFSAARAPRLDGAPGPCAWSSANDRKAIRHSASTALLERWVLEDVLPARAAEAHRRGDLHVLGAGSPHGLLTRSLPADLLGSRATWSRASAFDLVRRAGLALEDSTRGLFLEDVAGVLAALVEPGGASFERREAPVVDLVRSLGAAAEAAGRSLGLVRFGGKRGLAAGRLIRAVGQACADGGVAVQLHATHGEVTDAIAAAPEGELRAQTRSTVEALLASGHLVPVWAAKGARWVGPGCTRGRREQGALAVGTAVAVNLPRLARLAGPWREERFLQLLLERVATAVECSAAMATLQVTARHGQGELLASRIVHTLVPVGLIEALRILGDGVVKPDQGALVLGVLRDAGARLGRMADLQMEVTGSFQRPAAALFASADAPGEGPTQARLFEDLPRPEAEQVEAYGGALESLFGERDTALRRGLERARDLALLLGTTPAGALFPDLRDARSPQEQDFATQDRGGAVRADLDQTPRFGLWSQFEAHRGSGQEGGSGEAGNSLF